ncbi:Uncharacterised protein [Mycobacteroides abscessus subsp. massiliense]|nr:Uncharacterised protein [Mycobacteroides abscessus subsp. massiliense]
MAELKTIAIVLSVTAIPAEPMSSKGLRPTRSINAMATSVVAMFVMEVITVMVKDELSPNPTACHSTFE